MIHAKSHQSALQSVRRSRRRSGAANPLTLLVAAACIGLVAAGWMMFRLSRSSTEPFATGEATTEPLVVYCAAGIRPAASVVAKAYQQEFGVQVQLQYGGSNTLLSQIEASETGDLFIAADNSYILAGQEKNLVAEEIPLAYQELIIAVPKGNPKGIASIDDLLRNDVTTAIGNPDQAAIGKVARRWLTKSGHWDRLSKHVTQTGVFKPTVPEVANDILIGAIDAGIIWDATAEAHTDAIDTIRVPELSAGQAKISTGVLTSSNQPARALHFARYLGAIDKGLRTFKSKGFAIVDGDVWTDVPEMVFYCGSVNRRAVEPILKQFEQREGVSITTIYNGCGILSGQMKAIVGGEMPDEFPDVYMACDVYYMDVVDDMFQDEVNISETKIVMAVQKGNPLQIQTLQDLVKPGVRIVVGQPQQCTIGVLTKKLLEENGLYEDALKNIVSEKSTSSMLLAAVTTESADVALAYESDTLFSAGRIDVVQIDSPAAKAVQPFGIAKSSTQKYLSRRLFEMVTRSQTSFEDAGFDWRLDTNTVRPPKRAKSSAESK